MLYTTPACFSTFFPIYYGPYSSWNFLFLLVYLFVNFKKKTILLWLWLLLVGGDTAGWTL